MSNSFSFEEEKPPESELEPHILTFCTHATGIMLLQVKYYSL